MKEGIHNSLKTHTFHSVLSLHTIVTLTFTGLPGLALPKIFTRHFLLNMGCCCCKCRRRRRLHHKIHVLAFVCSFLLRDTYLLQMGRTD